MLKRDYDSPNRRFQTSFHNSPKKGLISPKKVVNVNANNPSLGSSKISKLPSASPLKTSPNKNKYNTLKSLESKYYI